MQKCKDCRYCSYVANSGGCNRYYCNNPIATAGVGVRVVCKCKRHTSDNIKTSPNWCPLREAK